MRLLCLVSGGCRWKLIREEWLPTTREQPYSRLVRFHECIYCSDTKATLTSPKVSETFFSIPNKFNVDVNESSDRTAHSHA